MWDEERYSVTGIGTITFQRELGSPLKLKDVMLIQGLKKISYLLQFWNTMVMMWYSAKERHSLDT